MAPLTDDCPLLALPLQPLEKVIAASPAIAEALESGLQWTTIRKEVADAFPNLPTFLAECGNAGHNTEQRQTKLQTLMALHRKSRFGRKTSTLCVSCWPHFEITVAGWQTI